jgi:hypothetical protein
MMKKTRRTEGGLALDELADQALNKADAIRVLRHHLRKQGREPETAEIAAVLAKTQWTTGDTNKDSQGAGQGRDSSPPSLRPPSCCG